jgi:two-component system response regulator (stage 0 sporulation protein F)
MEIQRMSETDRAKRVLLVEDNENSRRALADALQREGYEVVAVSDGLKALDILRWSWRPACVVLDMRMPVMTGWELRQTMEADPTLRDIPVLGMTGGHWKPEDAHGFAALLSKPIKLVDLLAALRVVAPQD